MGSWTTRSAGLGWSGTLKRWWRSIRLWVWGRTWSELQEWAREKDEEMSSRRFHENLLIRQATMRTATATLCEVVVRHGRRCGTPFDYVRIGTREYLEEVREVGARIFNGP